MTPQAASVLELFRLRGAYLEGHFRLTSGLHSSQYLQSALVLQYPEAAEELGRRLASELRRLTRSPADLVVSPALGGLIIGHEVARALGARFLFTERDGPTRQMALRRGFQVERPQKAACFRHFGGALHRDAPGFSPVHWSHLRAGRRSGALTAKDRASALGA